MRAKIAKIDFPRTSFNGDCYYQRVYFHLEDGRYAMTDLVSAFRNFARWKPIVESGVGTMIEGVEIKDFGKKTVKVDADSQVEIIQENLIPEKSVIKQETLF